jgi:CheY-like chemotaxis protein
LIVLDLLKLNPALASIPVIILTGMDPAVWKDKALDLGASAFFQKPADNDELMNAIRKHAGEGEPEIGAQ